MKNLIQTTVNFGGFYYSIHRDILDSEIDCLGYEDEVINFEATYNAYCKNYIKILNNILDINLIFKTLNSPKYYNFTTDIINVEISKKDILKLFKYVKDADLKEEVFNIIKDSSTSKDGYVAFYEYKDFFKKENIAILIECLFDVIVENLEDNIIDDIQSNYLDIVL